ncbi:hypothetical protein F4677DRAFT_444758 [Hypoxylon crocopeplum]|nr:hypothetical protein F4677DRAFT_444758 [Hypoxylon crocopeplum]
MAIDEEASLWPTENLLLKEGRKHYRTNVSPIHWQLRSLVSAERQDIVYFPTGANNTHITRLNTTTRECETIKVISFHPRCLVASKGWICCGGENGEFVVIRESRLSDTRNVHGDVFSSSSNSDDVRSTLNPPESSTMAEGSISQLHRDMLNLVERINGSNKTWSASSHKVGTERVNCITIWHPPQNAPEPGRYDSPVAVLANNDKTVTVVTLYEPDLPKDELEYPDCVNRSLISPDGSLLIAICDDPYLYVHVRRPFTKHYHGIPRQSFEWAELPRIRLKGQWNLEPTDCRGSFAACFSSSGKYLAVGTQYGTISIFDAVALKDPESEPLITYFDSDRAPGEYGAVRDMAFSPGPYDLLAWSEHRGKIGVADARTNFTRRQIVDLCNPDGFIHFSLNERNTIDPRLLDPRSERSTGRERSAGRSASLMDLLGRSSSGRPLPDPESDATSRLNQPFSADEVAILEAMQDSRQRREARDRGGPRDQPSMEYQNPRAAAGASTWRTPGWAERVSPPRTMRQSIPFHAFTIPEMSIRQRPHVSNSPQVERDLNSEDIEWVGEDEITLSHTSTSMPLINAPQRETLTRIIDRERMREARDNHRTSQSQTPPEQDRERRAPTPRRRSSIMQALTQNVDNMPQMMANRTQGQANDTNDSSTSISRERRSPWFVGRYTSGWTDMEAPPNASGGDGGLQDNPRTESSRTRRGIPAITDVWTNDLFSRIRMGSREHQQNSDDTAGLTWSEDGRTLYVGAEDGVYEFHINMHSRKVFPDITPR